MLPLCNISNPSLANVEKVVKPPQKPVVSNRHTACEAKEERAKRAYTTPMIKQPTRFTASVAQGNEAQQTPFISCDTRYLNAPPTKLPKPTSKREFSIIYNE